MGLHRPRGFFVAPAIWSGQGVEREGASLRPCFGENESREREVPLLF